MLTRREAQSRRIVSWHLINMRELLGAYEVSLHRSSGRDDTVHHAADLKEASRKRSLRITNTVFNVRHSVFRSKWSALIIYHQRLPVPAA